MDAALAREYAAAIRVMAANLAELAGEALRSCELSEEHRVELTAASDNLVDLMELLLGRIDRLEDARDRTLTTLCFVTATATALMAGLISFPALIGKFGLALEEKISELFEQAKGYIRKGFAARMQPAAKLKKAEKLGKKIEILKRVLAQTKTKAERQDQVFLPKLNEALIHEGFVRISQRTLDRWQAKLKCATS
jgi:hypothetical protein